MKKTIRRSEHGVALVAALIVMLLVVGVIAIFSMLAVGESQQGRADRQRAESLYWVETAAAQVLAQLRAHEIGPHRMAGQAGGAQLWTVPGPTGRRPLTVTTPSGATQQGYFEVLAPVQGGTPNTVAYMNSPADLQHRGEVRLVLRGSASAADPRPRAALVTFRRSSLAAYAMVSDAPIDIGNLGSSRIMGSIHSNNVQHADVGIRISGANTSAARLISTTQGSIQGGCSAARCVPGSEQSVSFTNVDRAFAEVERLHARGGCTASRRIACVHAPRVAWHPADTSPAYRVRLDGPGGCVTVAPIAMPLRMDAGAAAIVDDRRPPVGPFGATTSYCPSSPNAGFALLLNADVQVEGSRSGAPVTIMSRNSSRPTTIVSGQSTVRQQPGSIFVVQQGGRFGSSNPTSPVGLIAEGSVYLPDWAIASGNNRTLNVDHVAIAAKSGELSLGPMTLAMAGSVNGLSAGGANAKEGGGLNPCAGEAATFDRGAQLRIVGAVASRREPVLGYGTAAACSFGYSQRQYTYSEHLEWNPPPLYPTTAPWHVAAWDELAVGR